VRRWLGALVLGVLVSACSSGQMGDRTSPAASTSGLEPTTVGRPAVPVPGPPAPGTAGSSAPAPARAVGLPDPQLTPGVADPRVSQSDIDTTICRWGWSSSVRPPESYTEAVKRMEIGAGGTVSYQGVTYAAHGFELADPAPSHYELDHLVPLELGGSPADPANLWPESLEAPGGPAPAGTGSQTKDRVENAARAAVCSGRMTLAAARSAISSDWEALGRQLGA